MLIVTKFRKETVGFLLCKGCNCVCFCFCFCDEESAVIT